MCYRVPLASALGVSQFAAPGVADGGVGRDGVPALHTGQPRRQSAGTGVAAKGLGGERPTAAAAAAAARHGRHIHHREPARAGADRGQVPGQD